MCGSPPASRPRWSSAWSRPTADASPEALAAAQRWADVWQRCWEAGDVEGIVALYAPNASFWSEPFRDRADGRDGVRRYVTAAFADERDVVARFDRPIVSGNRAAVAWWAEMSEGGAPVTLAGTSLLRFDAHGLVIEQRDTWNQVAGRRAPPRGWGR